MKTSAKYFGLAVGPLAT